MMARARRPVWWWAVSVCGMVLALTACASGTATLQTTPTTPPTLVPVTCGAQFGTGYQATLPDASYPQTAVYAQVPLPPETRSYDSDASGLRVRLMCSAGTTAAVLAFMTAHLSQLGWQVVTPISACGRAAISGYAQPNCWQNGRYDLFIGINSNADWLLAFIDPAFLQ